MGCVDAFQFAIFSSTLGKGRMLLDANGTEKNQQWVALSQKQLRKNSCGIEKRQALICGPVTDALSCPNLCLATTFFCQIYSERGEVKQGSASKRAITAPATFESRVVPYSSTRLAHTLRPVLSVFVRMIDKRGVAQTL